MWDMWIIWHPEPLRIWPNILFWDMVLPFINMLLQVQAKKIMACCFSVKILFHPLAETVCSNFPWFSQLGNTFFLFGTPSALCPVLWACVSHSVVSDSLPSHGLQPARLLCPWDSPDKFTGVGSHSHLKGIFLTQGLKPGLLHCRQILYHMNHQGNPLMGLPYCFPYVYGIS